MMNDMKSQLITDEIRKELFRLQDIKYRDFQRKLLPTVDPDAVIGVRTPQLRSYAKQLAEGVELSVFLHELPHRYFEEQQRHALILSQMKDYESCMAEVMRFLPYIDNWATCDQLTPKAFKKNRGDLLKHIRKWMKSKECYTVRFAIGMLMAHYLDEDFDPAYPKAVAGIRSDEYYVNMMRAWYFATALAKQYESVIFYIEDRRLDDWTHNKTIQKAVESFRITPQQKEYLKTLRIR